MSSESNGTTIPKEEQPTGAESTLESKGKGKAVADPIPADTVMEEDDDDDEEEEDEDEEPSTVDAEDEEEEDMMEIEENNIVGSRTRGKAINFAEAAEKMGDELDEDDEDDDDFEDEEGEGK